MEQSESHISRIAKTLRKRLTDAERKLWKFLRAKRIDGYKFRRQEPIGQYIVDFVCHEKRIVLEVDGGQHALNKESDHERDKWLKEQGYQVLRFWNHEVLANMDGVSPSPSSPPIEGGEMITPIPAESLDEP